MTSSNQFSFYIPRMYANYTVEDVIHMFRLMYIGDVRRVDFVQLESTSLSNNYQSAFVHMECFYYSYVAGVIQETVFTYDDHYKLWVGNNEYWWLMKNINPVLDTNLNIHQVVENARILEKTVLEQDNKIKQQSEQIDRLQRVVDQIVEKCDEMINRESDKVFASAIDDLYYGIRSPDKYLWLTEDEKEDDNMSISTCSSMPSLIDQVDLMVLNPDTMSVSTDDSMPALLNDDSDDSARRRINFSRDLCDNS
jgi:hypothetical protein